MKGEKAIKSPDTQKKDRVPPGQKIKEKWPVLHLGAVPTIDVSKWTFAVSGLVEKDRKLDNLWEGVSTRVIREVVKKSAKWVRVLKFIAEDKPGLWES